MSSGEHATAVALPPPAARRRRQTLPRERDVTVAVAWAALAGLFGCVVVVVLCSGHTSVLLPDSLRPVPSWLAGPLGRVGPDIHLGGAIATLTTMCACYWTVVILCRRLPVRAILVAILGLCVIVGLGPPLLSTDVFSYSAYGRMGAIYGIDPYRFGPHSIFYDPLFAYVGSSWTYTPSTYGPLFTVLSYLLAPLGIEASAYTYKAIGIICSLATIAGVWRAAGQLDRDRIRAVALIGLNPVLIVYAIGGSHNDLIMLMVLSWSIVALLGDRASAGGGMIIAAAAVKLTAVIVLPFALLAPQPPRRTRRSSALWGAVATAAVISGLTALVFGDGPLRLLSTLQQIQANGGAQSIPGFVSAHLGFGRLSSVGITTLNVMLLAAVVGLLVAVRRRQMDWITAAGWSFAVLVVTSTFLLPWYTIWLLPFAALSSSRGLRWAALVLTAIGLTSL